MAASEQPATEHVQRTAAAIAVMPKIITLTFDLREPILPQLEKKAIVNEARIIIERVRHGFVNELECDRLDEIVEDLAK